MRGSRGFTLVELLVALLIAAVLAALGWPSYRDVLLRAHRGEARIALLAVQAAQERHYLDHLRYTDQLDAAPESGGLGLAARTTGGRYLLGLALAADGQHYVAHAEAAPGSPQQADRSCAQLSIDEAGTTAATSAGCWP